MQQELEKGYLKGPQQEFYVRLTVLWKGEGKRCGEISTWVIRAGKSVIN